MPFRAGAPFLLKNEKNCFYVTDEYQCPFGLRLHLYKTKQRIIRKYIDVSMPFRAGVPFLRRKWNSFRRCNYGVSMPFRAGVPFLRYPFQNLGFMRFLEPVFAGIYQNILTMAFFRAC